MLYEVITIFASSIILFPATMVGWFGEGEGLIWLRNIAGMLHPGQPVYTLLYASAIIFFCFFYTALVFNPKETADNLKKSGAFVPGIRPGEQPARITSYNVCYTKLLRRAARRSPRTGSNTGCAGSEVGEERSKRERNIV